MEYDSYCQPPLFPLDEYESPIESITFPLEEFGADASQIGFPSSSEMIQLILPGLEYFFGDSIESTKLTDPKNQVAQLSTHI